MTLAVLIEDGFLAVGSWKTAESRPHKVPWVHRKSGLYAFAIADKVLYIGLAEVLHRRLRNYGRRAFRNLNRPQRDPHLNLEQLIAKNVEVQIFAKVMPGLKRAQLEPLETALIVALQPAWNRTHKFK